MGYAPPEYLPLPDGYADRVSDLEAVGHPTAEANWMAASEAIGAVGRCESNDRDLFWHGDVPDEQREAWEQIADREAKRFYFHQKFDTILGYLAHRRHEERLNAKMSTDRGQRLTDFIKANGLWDAWVEQNRSRVGIQKGVVNDTTE